MININRVLYVNLFLCLVVLIGCDPATKIYIKNGLQIPIIIKIETKNTSLREGNLQPGESLPFWVLLGLIKKENISLKDIANQILFVEILTNDQQKLLDKEDFLESELVHYNNDGTKLTILIGQMGE